MGRFTAVIFDMDGLLLDSERPIRDAWIAACGEFGIQLTPEAYQGAIGLNPADSKLHLNAVLGGRVTFEAAEARVDEILAAAHRDSTFSLKPGAQDLVELLRGTGVPCAVASSSHHAEIRKRLRHVGILDAFGAIAGGDEVRAGKPNPDLYLLARDRLGIQQSGKCLVFEDSQPGALAGIAAEMSVIVVPDLRPPSEEVQRRCLAVLSSLAEAIPMCKTWFGVA